MEQTENIAIFEHTQKLFRTDPKLISAIRYSNSTQEVFLEANEIEMAAP